MDTQVRITLHPSRTLFFLLAAIWFFIVLAITKLPLANGWHWLGYFGISASTAWLLWRDVALQSGRSCIAFVCGKDRHISLQLRNGLQSAGVVCADTLVFHRVVILNVAAVGHGTRSLLLFWDAMSADAHRRLRVLLRNS